MGRSESPSSGSGSLDDVLAHYGIRGMKWGVRRTKKQLNSAHTSEDATKAHEYKTRAKTSGTSSLSNKELQHLVNRMNLEQQYGRLASNNKKMSAGAKFARDILIGVGKQQAIKLANDAASKQVAQLLKK